MKKLFFSALTAVFFMLFLAMCTTVEPVTEPEPEQVIEQPEPEPVSEPVVETPAEDFVVSEELYVETFGDIKLMIERLNDIIAAKDYNTWLTYLTDDYITYYSAPDKLAEYTELYKQRGYNYRILDLEDYFLYLVVISRSNAVVDEIKFTDSTHITALTELKGQLSVLYYLEKNENGWKIGLKP